MRTPRRVRRGVFVLTSERICIKISVRLISGGAYMRPMSDERAIENAIVSTQMEGFEVTESDRKLLMKIIKKEITLDEALKKINSSYRN